MSSLVSLYFFENETLNKYNIIWLLGLILIYFLVTFNTVYWYFFPHPLLYHIFEEVAPYALIFQIGLILFVISMTRGFFTVRMEYNEGRLKKVPIPAVCLFSVMIPILSFVNNFTGNFLFSMGLLAFGVIFTVLAFKFR